MAHLHVSIYFGRFRFDCYAGLGLDNYQRIRSGTHRKLGLGMIRGMQNPATRVICIACAVSGMTLTTSAQRISSTSQIKAMYRKIEACSTASDCDTIINMLHPSYQMIDANGKTSNYDESTKMMREMAKTFQTSMRNMTVKFDFERIDVRGQEATVWVTMRSKFESKQGSKWVKTGFDEKYVETLRKTEAGWKFTETIVIPK